MRAFLQYCVTAANICTLQNGFDWKNAVVKNKRAKTKFSIAFFVFVDQ